ncbi:MAG: response regulator [Defluviitaleaceae bacterium]|nr:response regulator [Defluviitaleaceae bacterium]
MTLLKESSIRRRLYLAFACMWAIMIFFAFFRGQQLGTVMNRYNEAIININDRQQNIRSIVTALSSLNFDNLLLGALGNHPDFYEQIMLQDRLYYKEALQTALNDQRVLIINDTLLSDEEKTRKTSMIDYIHYVFNNNYIKSSENIWIALESGDEEIIAEAFYLNFVHGLYLQELVWELRDETFALTTYITETMRYYDGADERIFNIATVLGVSIAIFLALVLAHTIQKPISQLRFAVNEVTLGNMEYPIRMNYTDDIGKLSHNIADMVESISEMINTDAEQRHRIEQQQISEAFVRKLLDNSPFFIEFWDTDGNALDCSERLLELLGVSDKDEFAENFYKVSAKMQACGSRAKELNRKMMDSAMKQGRSNTEWTYLLPDGSELPTDTTWVRVEHQERVMIIVYRHDLRPIKASMRRELDLEERNRAKTRFLARMSHEIRTPITAVMGISELQLREQSMPPHIEESFSKIYDSSKSLLHIVNDILDFSKIEAGKMTLHEKEYNVANLLSDVSYLHLIYLENSDISFAMHVDSTLPAKMVGDVLRIKQIINNLLTNAFKYTEVGSISMSFSHETNHEEGYTMFLISIEDTGMGMLERQIAEFHASDNDYLRLYEEEKPFVSGTGLGIPIVFSMVQMMNAEIDFKSEVGKGTLVTVSIPQKIEGDEVLGEELAVKLQNFESVTWSDASNFEFVAEQMPYGKVLVVDDVEMNLYVAEAMLGYFGLDIELVESGEAAIEKISQGETYDIIFLDHMMPGMDGIEVAEKLREMGYAHPIVALTANAIKGQAEMFIDNGFSGFMSKPIDIKILNSYLVRFIKNKHLEVDA